LSRAESWIRRLDAQAEGTEKQFYTYAVQNRRADELVGALQAMFGNEATSGKGTAPTRNVVPPYQEASVHSAGLQPTSAGGAFTGATGSIATPTRPPAGSVGSRPPSTATAVGGDPSGAEPRIRLAADGPKNAVLIEATPADYRRVMKVVAALDVIPNQVMIEATIAEVSLNDDLKMGVRWYFQNKKGNSNATFTDAASGALGSVFPGFSYALTAANLSTTLNALSEITNVNVVSSPSLTVMDNSTAVLQIGDQVPITTQSASSVLGAGAPIVNSVSYKDTGVILTMTPRINESGRVLLEIEQEVSNVVSTTSSTIDSPTIRQRRVRTSVVVNNGEPLALGGMIQESKTISRTQVPIVGEIPILGNAFKQKDNSIGKTELIIIITPHVMRNLDEARLVTDEYRREFERHVLADRDHMRRIQRGGRRLLE
jgi:general secretion pathway protein D